MSLTTAQLAMRRSMLSATDMVSLVGESPYGRGPHDVWVSKCTDVTDSSESEAMSLGNELEPVVLRRMTAKRGLHILPRDPATLTVLHPTIPHHGATPDAFLAESLLHDPCAVGEAKVVGARNWSAWGEDEAEIPDWCLVQVTWQMHVTRLPVAIVGALLGTEVRTYRIALDESLEGALVDEAERFWKDHVLRRQPPAVDGSPGARRMLSAIWPRSNGTLLRATPESELLAKAYFDAKRDRDDADSRAELAMQGLQALIGEADGVAGDGWRMLLKLREEQTVSYIRKAYRHADIRTIQKKGRAA